MLVFCCLFTMCVFVFEVWVICYIKSKFFQMDALDPSAQLEVRLGVKCLANLKKVVTVILIQSRISAVCCFSCRFYLILNFFRIKILKLVRAGRLELPRLAALDPKSSASTSSATLACRFLYKNKPTLSISSLKFLTICRSSV